MKPVPPVRPVVLDPARAAAVARAAEMQPSPQHHEEGGVSVLYAPQLKDLDWGDLEVVPHGGGQDGLQRQVEFEAATRDNVGASALQKFLSDRPRRQPNGVSPLANLWENNPVPAAASKEARAEQAGDTGPPSLSLPQLASEEEKLGAAGLLKGAAGMFSSPESKEDAKERALSQAPSPSDESTRSPDSPLGEGQSASQLEAQVRWGQYALLLVQHHRVQRKDSTDTVPCPPPCVTGVTDDLPWDGQL